MLAEVGHAGPVGHASHAAGLAGHVGHASHAAGLAGHAAHAVHGFIPLQSKRDTESNPVVRTSMCELFKSSLKISLSHQVITHALQKSLTVIPILSRVLSKDLMRVKRYNSSNNRT